MDIEYGLCFTDNTLYQDKFGMYAYNIVVKVLVLRSDVLKG